MSSWKHKLIYKIIEFWVFEIASLCSFNTEDKLHWTKGDKQDTKSVLRSLLCLLPYQRRILLALIEKAFPI